MAKEGVAPVSRLVVGFLRLFSDKKQADFADASGVYQPDVSKYESGDKAPTERTLHRLAAAAGVPWFAVPHLRRFFGGLIDAARGGIGVQPGEEEGIERAILKPARLAVAAYRIEDEAAATIPHQTPEELAREAEQTWEALERFPVRRRQVAEWLPPRRRNWALVVRACEASLKAAVDKPAESLELAALALDMATQLPETSASGGAGPGRSQLQGYCWGHLANAHRVATDFDGAHEGFTRAWELWRAGQESASRWLPEWRLLSLEASLRREQRRFSEALGLLDRALTLGKGEPAAMARCLLKKEHVYEVLGDFAAALDALTQAAPFVEASRNLNLLLVLRYNTADDLRHLKRFAEAAVLLPEIRELALQQGAELDGLRVALLAARIAAGLGQKADAVAGLERVRQRFTELELPYEAALASLDLAVLWLEEGRTAEVRVLALTMAWIFDAKGIHREALAALQLFLEAVESDAFTVDLVRRAIAEIERVKRSGSPEIAKGES